MLWTSGVKSVTDRMLIEAESKANYERKKFARKALDFYHGCQLEALWDDIKSTYIDPSAFKPAFVNITKKIINQLSIVYIAPANRIIDGTDSDKEIFSEIIESSSLDIKMKVCSRYTQLLKTTMLKVVFRNNHIDIDILTPDVLDVTIRDGVPEDLESVLITNYPESGKIEDLTYSLWRNDTFKKLDHKGNTLESEENPYQIIPMVPVWSSFPTGGAFFQPDSSEDLITANEVLNAKLSDLLLILSYQGYGQPVFKGVKPGDHSNQLGPNIAIELEDPNSDFEYKKSEAPLREFLNSLDWIVKSISISNGLPRSSISQKSHESSGVARIIENRELEEIRRDQIALFNTYEKKLFKMCRTVWNTHMPNRKISENAKIFIDFYDPKPTILAPDVQTESWERELQMGTLSRLDIIQLKNPDLSREQAQAKLDSIIAENKKFKNSVSQP